ncbi:hypothetical protein TVAG_359870 [Trichomonas vaginalis G3]|uniref:Uncharacterized protein n=1 Tax=Trichomonas vaginalis (strain ATCC PRA-98 / G3) TaxID=412133 RepID=A2DTA6_TRIV3|nr:armadillo (ARM) repeat-containing protein family [Trichomonas vaginalis G3]EAY16378.1 hypothetical protein TVAG_359870 [Trichomonas vaginalis G3]KAI5488394.1 armadillo (ARM) repeat-containing protein family [Trichomonas vaginalis G3]|eukprot:XP_001328601.1 hypothetical protein [Trichomonas vaginalis G3]
MDSDFEIKDFHKVNKKHINTDYPASISHNEDYANYCIQHFLEKPNEGDFYLPKLLEEISNYPNLQQNIADILNTQSVNLSLVELAKSQQLFALDEDTFYNLIRILQFGNRYVPKETKKSFRINFEQIFTATLQNIENMTFENCLLISEILKICIKFSKPLPVDIIENNIFNFIESFEDTESNQKLRYILLNSVAELAFRSNEPIFPGKFPVIIDFVIETITKDLLSCYSSCITIHAFIFNSAELVLNYIHNELGFSFINTFLGEFDLYHYNVLQILLSPANNPDYQRFLTAISKCIDWSLVSELTKLEDNLDLFLDFIHIYVANDIEIIPKLFNYKIIDTLLQIVSDEDAKYNIREKCLFTLTFCLENYSFDNIIHVLQNGLAFAINDIGIGTQESVIISLVSAFTAIFQQTLAHDLITIYSVNKLLEDNSVFNVIDEIIELRSEKEEVQVLSDLYVEFRAKCE